MTITGTAVRISYEGDGATILFAFTMEVTRDSDVVCSWRDANGVETDLTQDVDYTLTRTIDALGKSTGGTVLLTSLVFVADEWFTILARPLATQDEDLSNFGSFNSQAVEDALDRLTIAAKYMLNDMDDGRYVRLPDSAIASEDHGMDAQARRIGNALDAVDLTDLTTLQQVNAAITAAEITPGTISGLTSWGSNFLTSIDGDAGMTALGITAFMQGVVKGANLAAVNTALGYAAFLKSFLERSTAPDALGDLGLTSLMQTLMLDGTTAAARATLEVVDSAPRNFLANGDFQVFQNGDIGMTTPQTWRWDTFDNSNGTAGRHAVDEWKCSGPADQAVSMEQMDVINSPEGSAGACEVTQLLVDTKWGIFNRLSQADAGLLQGKEISFSLDVLCPDTMSDFKAYLIYSVADATTETPAWNAWNGLTTEPTWSGGWTVVSGGDLTISATAAWATYKAEGITLPSSFKDLGLLFISNSASMPVSDRCRISAVQILQSATAHAFAARTFQEELDLCRLRYQKTWRYGKPPIVDSQLNIGSGNEIYEGSVTTYGGIRALVHWQSTPSMIDIDGSAGNKIWSVGWALGQAGAAFTSAAGANVTAGIGINSRAPTEDRVLVHKNDTAGVASDVHYMHITRSRDLN